MAGTLYQVGRGIYCAGAVVASSAAVYLRQYGCERDLSWTDLVTVTAFYLVPCFVLLVATHWFRALAGGFLVASAVIYLAVFALVLVDLSRSPIPQLKGGLMFAAAVQLLNYLLLPPLAIAWVFGVLMRFYGSSGSPNASPNH